MKVLCKCMCGCAYTLRSPRSLETFTCFSCRHELHYGSYLKGMPRDDA